MHQTDSQTAAPFSRRFFTQLGFGLFWFTAVLTGSLLLSWVLLLPRFTRFTIGEQTLSPRAMADRERALHAQLLNMEQKRSVLVLPFRDALLTHIKQTKHALPSVRDIRQSLHRTIALHGTPAPVKLETIIVDIAQRHVEVRGMVTAGSSSLTVLAAFLDDLEALPFVHDLQRPALIRQDDPTHGIIAPFLLSFTLTPPQ
jgi:hypothetical protein